MGLVLSMAQLRAGIGPHGQEPATSQLLAALVVLGFLSWLGYAVLVQFGHLLVFYGRILHFFVPFVVMGALVALQRLVRQWQHGSQWLLVGGGALVLWHFFMFVGAYRTVAYPADVVYDYGIWDARQIASISTTGCDQNVVLYRPFGPRLRNQPTAAIPRYELVNFAYLYPVSCYRPINSAGRKVVISVPYFMRYTPYQFEGHNAPQRALLQNNEYDFRIVRAD